MSRRLKTAGKKPPRVDALNEEWLRATAARALRRTSGYRPVESTAFTLDIGNAIEIGSPRGERP